MSGRPLLEIRGSQGLPAHEFYKHRHDVQDGSGHIHIAGAKPVNTQGPT